MLQHPPKVVFDYVRKYRHHLVGKKLTMTLTRHKFSFSEASREVMLDLNYPHVVSGTNITEKSGVAIITLNRPRAANALGFNLMKEMKEILNYLNETIDQNQQRCCIIRSSSPKVFCAGADLKERKSMNMSEVVECVDKLRQTFEEMSRLPMPTISVIEGAAFGGGFEMALATDIRIASTNATFGLVETSLAIIPGAGGTQRLPRLIGAARAKELIFTARKFNAEKALEMGIVQHTAEPGKAMQKALSIAGDIATNGPLAVRAAKMAIDRGLDTLDMSNALEIEKECYASILPSYDRLEGLDAFHNMRQPVYLGK